MIMGNINRETLLDIYYSEKMRALRESLQARPPKLPTPCAGCTCRTYLSRPSQTSARPGGKVLEFYNPVEISKICFCIPLKQIRRVLA